MPAEFVQRGRAHLEHGEYQEAVKVCRLGLLANPGEIEGRIVLGGALLALQRFDEVLAEMRVALDMDPANSSALALRGEALLRKGDTTKAVELLDQAAAVSPGDSRIARLAEEARSGGGGRSGGERGTIDIDPELEGIEIRESRHFGVRELARRDAMPSGWTPNGPQPLSQPAIEISSADLVPVEDSHAAQLPDSDQAMVAEEPTALYRHPDLAPAEQPMAPFDDHSDELPFEVDARDPQRGMLPSVDVDAPVAAARIAAPAPEASQGDAINRLFPEDESGVSKLELIDPVSGEPTGPPPMAEGHGFDPAMAGVDGYPEMLDDGVGRSATDDMRLIRRGLGMEADSSESPAGAQSVREAPDHQPERRPRPDTRGTSAMGRRSLPVVVYACVLVLVVLGGVFLGFEIRTWRLARQMDSARQTAASLVTNDRFADHKRARDILARVVDAGSNASDRVVLARYQASLAAEFGHGRSEAEKLVAKLGSSEEPEAVLARAFMALSRRDASELEKLAVSLRSGGDHRGLGQYLIGRAYLLSGRYEDAAAALQNAFGQSKRPAFAVALARAQHLRGEAAAALEVLAQVQQSAPNHPWAVIWEARIRTQHALVPADSKHLETALTQLSGGGSGAASVSSDQIAWATLALGELQLAQGHRDRAGNTVKRAMATRPPDDWEFSEELGRFQIELGDMDAARTEAEMAARNWPERPAAHVLLAHISLAQDDAVATLSHLTNAGAAVESLPTALLIRARANVELGKLDAAAADTDSVLASRPTWREAIVLRAQVDLLRDDARSALARLEPLASDARDPSLVVAYSAALRASGRFADARAVLAKLMTQTKSVAALVEKARLEQSQGRYGQARSAYEEAIVLDPGSVDARLGAALLELDDGNAKKARESIEALVKDAGYRARILVEAARVRTLTGDAEGAEALLAKASDVSTSLVWMVARERGRLLLRRLRALDAVAELTRAKSLKPDDTVTRLLLMQAHYQARSKRGAAKTLAEIAKSFRGSALWATSSGLDALLRERAVDAMAAFKEARSKLIDAKAPPREMADVSYWLGRAHEFEGGLVKAKEWMQNAIKLNSMHADAYYWLGQIAFQQNDIRGMIKAYETSVEIDPGAHPLAWFYLGQEYVRLKRPPAAKRAYEMFLKYWPEKSGDLVAEARAALARL